MKVFADAAYWLATARLRDQWQEAAIRARAGVGESLLVTTDEVLTEFLAGMSACGRDLRLVAVETVERLLGDPNVEVIPQSRQGFLTGLELYRERLDKTYSLTDCISMQTMRREGLTEVLTNDRHFQQEGFRVLILQPGGSV